MLYRMTESALEIIARHLSTDIVMHELNGSGNPFSRRRKATKTESKTLFKIAYSALISLNYCARENKEMRQAILNNAEFTLKQFIPDVNAYDSIYCKLWCVLDPWEGSTKDEKVEHWVYTGIRNLFPEEIDYIDHYLDYPQEEILPFGSLEEAKIQIDGMLENMDPDEPFPEALKNPYIMFLLWNTYARTM